MPDLFDNLLIRALVGLIFGLIFGSFTTMLSYRLPRGQSIVTPPSACPSCKARLRGRDLIPVLSWLFQRGRCRYCATPIGARYIVIEAAVALACMVAFVLIGLTLWLPLAIAAIIAVFSAIVIRLER